MLIKLFFWFVFLNLREIIIIRRIQRGDIKWRYTEFRVALPERAELTASCLGVGKDPAINSASYFVILRPEDTFLPPRSSIDTDIIRTLRRFVSGDGA